MLFVLLEDREYAGRSLVAFCSRRDGRSSDRHAVAEDDQPLGLQVYDDQQRAVGGKLRLPDIFAILELGRGLEDRPITALNLLRGGRGREAGDDCERERDPFHWRGLGCRPGASQSGKSRYRRSRYSASSTKDAPCLAESPCFSASSRPLRPSPNPRRRLRRLLRRKRTSCPSRSTPASAASSSRSTARMHRSRPPTSSIMPTRTGSTGRISIAQCTWREMARRD